MKIVIKIKNKIYIMFKQQIKLKKKCCKKHYKLLKYNKKLKKKNKKKKCLKSKLLKKLRILNKNFTMMDLIHIFLNLNQRWIVCFKLFCSNKILLNINRLKLIILINKVKSCRIRINNHQTKRKVNTLIKQPNPNKKLNFSNIDKYYNQRYLIL